MMNRLLICLLLALVTGGCAQMKNVMGDDGDQAAEEPAAEQETADSNESKAKTAS